MEHRTDRYGDPWADEIARRVDRPRSDLPAWWTNIHRERRPHARVLLAFVAVLVLLAAFWTGQAHADTVVATVTAPTMGGPVASYELFMDGAKLGNVVIGSNSFPNAIQPGGTHTYRVDSINAAGRTKGDDVVFPGLPDTPGKAGLLIMVTRP